MASALAPVAEDKLPKHVAIIMDGNGRWAKARGMIRTQGHRKGADALKNVLEACADMGIPYLTVYAFSSENWGRPKAEVTDLMQLLKFYLEHELKTLIKQKVRLKVIGDLALLDNSIRQKITAAEEKTAHFTHFQLTIALSYGSRNEMVAAMQAIAEKVKKGEIAPDAVTEQTISEHLYTASLPDPDLLIRTGGEKRLSNFLLWQQAYTELYFTDTYWPDFDADALKTAVTAFAQRERRYGNAEE